MLVIYDLGIGALVFYLREASTNPESFTVPGIPSCPSYLAPKHRYVSKGGYRYPRRTWYQVPYVPSQRLPGMDVGLFPNSRVTVMNAKSSCQDGENDDHGTIRHAVLANEDVKRID